MEIDVINAFADKVAEAIKNSYMHKELWRIDDIADYLNCSRTQASSRYVCQPDFPAKIRLPNGEGYSHPQWYAHEVREWVSRHQQTQGRRRER